MSELVVNIGGTIYIKKYHNYPSHREMVLSLGNTLEKENYAVCVEFANNWGVSFVWDGHKMGTKDIVSFRVRGFDRQSECKQVYLDIVE